MALVMLLASCGGGDSNVRPTRFPTSVPPPPTPRSTALPPVEYAPVVGSAERPVKLLVALHGSDVDTAARRAGIELADQLEDALESSVEVSFVDENAALRALCSGQPHAAWVNAFTYTVAQAECGAVPALAIQRGRLPNITVGRSAELVTPTEITEPGQLAGQTFCRSEEHDLFTTWIYPGLLLSAAGVDPLVDLEQTLDYPDDLSLLFAMSEGTCDAAALPQGTLDDYLYDLALLASTETDTVTVSEMADRLHVLIEAGATEAPASTDSWAYSANVVPYELLVFPPESALPADLRDEMTAEIEDFFADRASGEEYLNELLDATGVLPVTESTYTSFRALVASSGWDMTYVP